MRTRSSSNLIAESFTIPKQRNCRHSKQIVKPELRTIVETPVATMADTHTMSELLQAPTKGYVDDIVIPAILAENFELKVGLLSLVTSSQFHGFERDDPHSHIRWFNKITFTLKYKSVPHDAIKLMLFLVYIEGAAHTWLEKESLRSIHTWEDLRFSEAWDRFKDLLRKCPHHDFSELHQIDTFYNALTQSDQDSLNAAAGGNLLNSTPRDALTIIENKSKVRTSRNKPVVSKVNTTTSSSSLSPDVTPLTEIVKELVLMNKANQQVIVKAIEETCKNPSGLGSLPSNTVANPRGDVKAITTRSDVSYDGPTIPPTSFPLLNEVERETKATKDKVQPTSSESAAHVQPLVVQIPILEPKVAPKPNLKPFANALFHMRKCASTFKSLLSNKEKLFELASTPLNKNCLAVLLKKLLVKHGDPDKFLIPCDFLELEECLALADLGASINLMPFFVWKKLLLPELTPTRMTLELANRSVSYPVGVAEDVFVKVGKFYFSADFVVVDYNVDPRVPLILGRPFLRMARALIDVHSEELTLRVNNEAITFKVGHTSRYSRNYYDETVNQINVTDVACEEYAQEVLRFLDSLTSGNPTPLDPIISFSSPSFTPFKGGDFILEEIEAFLHPYSNLPSMKNDDLNQVDVTMTKPLIEEPPKLELKDLPSHLEYAFLEGTNKLPIIISKKLKDKEKILMEDDYNPTVQHQRRVNPKIHKVFKKEVIKLFDARLIYPIFDSLWVSTIHCVPKKGGMTVIENEDNELIPTRDSLSSCLFHLDKMLKRCEDTNLVLNWEKFHFMVKEGIVLGHKISKSEIEVDRAKVDVIAKLPHPTSVKGV
uniref:Reverse transcriptase domain-containing protein n=1 Tax=Tanacetum cinerariifolium TaxID=118510 RepID=A0A6L2N5Y7_TANCI|nr:reverse transcriptase domain-containing protein [Tanacetum cinerariifolium]